MDSPTPLVWLITGTSSGFGSCLVASVLARGDRVIATARSVGSISHLEENPNVRVRQLDVTAGAAAIAAIVDEAVGVWGRLDVVVNNAGMGYPGLLEEGGSGLLRTQFEVNFFGIMDVCAACLPHMRARKSGTIVIVGSRSAWKPEIPGLGVYATSKAAVHALSEALTVEVAPHGVRVLLVEPGAFRTKIAATPFFQQNDIADYDEMRRVGVARFGSLTGTEPGDPAKAMEVVVDVVRGGELG
ncbi:UBR-type domain-containing protein [Mycena sanguinolenta]|uniref:UBR-type domain-containing protein n=1 Tax=Mycena sanguinolenta TaxID=230812 RepID=A0A8H6ZEL5_9AGAR|nr:UBR-type domain-containing protein [Mycena sanguinolenta]